MVSPLVRGRKLWKESLGKMEWRERLREFRSILKVLLVVVEVASWVMLSDVVVVLI